MDQMNVLGLVKNIKHSFAISTVHFRIGLIFTTLEQNQCIQHKLIICNIIVICVILLMSELYFYSKGVLSLTATTVSPFHLLQNCHYCIVVIVTVVVLSAVDQTGSLYTSSFCDGGPSCQLFKKQFQVSTLYITTLFSVRCRVIVK